MKQSLLCIALLALLLGSADETSAFWGKRADESVSGLNVATGYDVNTVATLTGTVAALPVRTDSAQYALMPFVTPLGGMVVVLGPWTYWEQHAIPLTIGMELTVTGSRAQGRDGRYYLFARSLDNAATGETVMLRSAEGVPLWAQSGTNHRTTMPNHTSGMGTPVGTMPRHSGGTGMRGGMGGGRR